MSTVNKMLIVIIMKRMMMIKILVQSLYTVYSKEITITIIVYLLISAIVSIDNIKQDNIFTVSIPSSLERGVNAFKQFCGRAGLKIFFGGRGGLDGKGGQFLDGNVQSL